MSRRSSSASSWRERARVAGGGALLIALVLAVPSCGYRLASSAGSRFVDPALKVDVRPFANDSVVPDAGAVIAARLREEMVRSGFRGTFQRTGADYQVEGRVREIQETVSSHGADDFALEHRLAVVVDIRVVEVVRGRLLWKEEGLGESASYYAGSDFQYTESNRRAAFEEVSRRLARRIGQTLRVLL